MAVSKFGQWPQARAATRALAARFKAAEAKATLQEGHHFRAKVIEAFDTSGASNGKPWAANEPSVIAGKGSSKPLINRADLRNSVTVISQGGQVFIGVPNKKRAKNGQPMTSIAEVHEEGRIIFITVTPQMRAFVMAKMRQLGAGTGNSGSGGLASGTLMIVIRKRSFLQATADAHYSNRAIVQDRYLRRVAALMGPGWSSQAAKK